MVTQPVRVLYVTANPHLRSTTSTLDAVFRQLVPHTLAPVMVFGSEGPWQQQLAAGALPTYVVDLSVPDVRKPLDAMSRVWQLVRIVRRHSVDVIHCNEHELFPLVRRVARLARRPVVVTVHFQFEQPFGRWLFRRPFEPEYLQFVSAAVLHESQPGIPTARTRTVVIPNALAVEDYVRRSSGWEECRSRLNLEPNAILIGTASAIRRRKRLEDFVELLAVLTARGLPVFGVIAGGHPFGDPVYEQELSALIDARGLKGRCLMVGNVDPVAPWLRAFDVFVSTSEVEPFGMSVCEAMACGTPSVAYDAGGVSDVIHNERWVAPNRDLSKLADRVQTLCQDADLRTLEGHAAAAHVRRRFDSGVVAPQQLRVYQDAVARRRH